MPIPLVIGHACAGGEAPHNTLAGVRACLATGAHAMEIDVRLSADGVPVLMHDATVDRTTNLSGPVSSFTAAELAAADAGDGEKVPTLREVLERVDGRLTVMCELKSHEGPREEQNEYRTSLVRAVVKVCGDCGAEQWTAVHSFDRWIVLCAREVDVGMPAALISPPVDRGEWADLFERTLASNAQAVSMHFSSVDREFVLAAKKRQLTVYAWTPDEESEWARLCDAGVDGIITNYPTRLTQFLASGS